MATTTAAKTEREMIAQLSDGSDIELLWVREPTDAERAPFAAWARDILRLGIRAADRVVLSHISHGEFLAFATANDLRRAEYFLPGHSSSLWHLTPDAWQALSALEQERAEAAARREADAQAAEYVYKRGHEITDADGREGWEFVGVENDAHGVYRRRVN